MTPQKTVLNVQSKVTYSGQSGNYAFTATLANVNKEKPEQIIERKKDSRYNISMPFNYGHIYEAMEEYASQQSAALESENKELRKVLKELVELKEMKDEIDRLRVKESIFRDEIKWPYLVEKYKDYEIRKPLAWEAARKIKKISNYDNSTE